MPMYEFHCTNCQKSFESLMKPHDPVACPHCDTKEVNKVWSSKTKVSHRMTGDNSASTTPKRDRVQ